MADGEEEEEEEREPLPWACPDESINMKTKQLWQHRFKSSRRSWERVKMETRKKKKILGKENHLPSLYQMTTVGWLIAKHLVMQTSKCSCCSSRLWFKNCGLKRVTKRMCQMDKLFSILQNCEFEKYRTLTPSRAHFLNQVVKNSSFHLKIKINARFF